MDLPESARKLFAIVFSAFYDPSQEVIYNTVYSSFSQVSAPELTSFYDVKHLNLSQFSASRETRDLTNGIQDMLENLANDIKGPDLAHDREVKEHIATLKPLLPKDGSVMSYNREKLKAAALKLSLSLETPGDTVQRIAYLPLQTTVVRIANTLEIFDLMLKHNDKMSGKEIASAVNANHVLITRLLRYLAAIGTIEEVGVDMYSPSNITRNLTIPNLKAGMNHTYDVVDASGMALPSFLIKNGYRNPDDVRHCPFQDAFSTEDDLFQWFPKHPVELRNFDLWMTGQRDGRTGWLDFFPFETQVSASFEKPELENAVMLVDVGGGMGHEVGAIKAKHPKLPGQFILQDLPDTLKKAVTVPGMTTMAYDFFTPQPIQGSRVYYLRNILHDWPDHDCVKILSNTASAMKKGYSKMLLNEFVLPDRGASMIATQVDITMMVCLAGAERTESQFRGLLDAAGLQLVKIWGDDADAERILEVELK
ncbi:hypothetical protein ACLMJK_006844 [Lecanora helva]